MTWSIASAYSCRECLGQPILEPDGVTTLTNEDAAMAHLEENPTHHIYLMAERVDDPEE